MNIETAMYLLVFITLVISLMGLYTQVLALETAHLAQSQTSVAQAMLAWHATAVAQARYTQIYFPNPAAAAAGCSLTPPPNGPAGVPMCQNSGGANVTVGLIVGSGFTACFGPPAAPCWTTLPTGYSTAYTFYSIYYQPAGSTQSYVITFVPPPPATPGMVMLPGNVAGASQLGITLSEFYSQLKRTGIMPASYGAVSGGALVTGTISDGTGPNVVIGSALPTAYTFTNGTIAVISNPGLP